MYRRTALMLIATSSVAGCANRGPRPTTQTVDIRSIGLLSIKETAPTGDTGSFNAALVLAAPNANIPPPVSPTMLGMFIGATLRASSEATAAASRSSISRALQPVGFAPREALSQALATSFSKRSLPISAVANETAGEKARTDWDFSQLPPGLDAVLDVTIDYAGYFPAKEAGGFSPTLYVSATLLSTVGRGGRLEHFYYQADHRDAEGERRFYTTPATTLVKSLDELRERGPVIRTEMTSIMSAIAEQLAIDIERAIKKLPPLA